MGLRPLVGNGLAFIDQAVGIFGALAAKSEVLLDYILIPSVAFLFTAAPVLPRSAAFGVQEQ